MRPNLFGANIAGEVNAALGPGLLPATLTRTTAGTRDPPALSGGETVGQASASYACRGFLDEYTAREITGTLVRASDRKAVLLGKSLPDDIDPMPGDVIAIEGANWRIVGPVKRDPAGATFTCPVRQ